ncbi:MAG: fumarate hydratase C-terminal domain-containing protein [Victivallales bacterium]|nr:fumarate hydratase C-terminal domain-containing protein [Victivallales bacterium]
MITLQLPLTEEDVRGLALGDAVSLTGTIFTARDAAHKYLVENPDFSRIPDIRSSVLYHCGPVIIKQDGRYVVTAAGPTTSIREEPYMAAVIEKYGIRAIIGKGGLGPATAEACRRFGCVYLSAVGGAAQVLASCVKEVPSVSMLEEFGAPEAIWQLNVVDFPAVVTMDATGASLHQQVKARSEAQLAAISN